MFFKKENNENDDLTKIAALLIHAAKIDENFSISEEKIIKKALLESKILTVYWWKTWLCNWLGILGVVRLSSPLRLFEYLKAEFLLLWL